MRHLALLPKKWNEYLWNYFIVGLGSIICGVGINAFMVPHHMLSGGIGGIAIINYFLFNWPIGIQIALMNLPLFVIAYRLLDREYVIGAIYGMAVFAVSIDITAFLANYHLVEDIILSALYGGVIFGIGSGLTFRVNGSAGGLDIVSAIIKKYYSFNMGIVGFAFNIIIMLVAAFLFGAPPALYTLLSMYISAIVTDKVIEGFNHKKTVMIISMHSNAISSAILSEMGRGVTFLQGEGAYSKQNMRVILVVVTLTQIAKVKQIVQRVDPRAFMIIQDAVEVAGKGF